MTSTLAFRERMLIESGANDLVFDAEGRSYIDLFAGNGAALLGHADAVVRDAVKRQLDGVWITGALSTPIGVEARHAVEAFFPDAYRLAGLYSTGMEAAEFALRVARVVTGRAGFVGFDGCMHGKSMATAHLGWHNDHVELPSFTRVPYVPACSEADILERLSRALSKQDVAAVFVEPLQGSAGGHLPSRAFFHDVAALCARHGTLLVADEIFTGFHRTGPAFLHQELGLAPDIVLVGKAMGNGFPVSGVVVERRHAVDPRMLPSSTFAGNPLAAAAVVATLSRMQELDVRSRVESVERIISEQLAPVRDAGIALRGKGALWVLELPRAAVDAAMARILDAGVIVSPTARYLRVLPAATILDENLVKACGVVREACLDLS